MINYKRSLLFIASESPLEEQIDNCHACLAKLMCRLLLYWQRGGGMLQYKTLPIDSYQQGSCLVIERYAIHGRVQHSVLQTHYKQH